MSRPEVLTSSGVPARDGGTSDDAAGADRGTYLAVRGLGKRYGTGSNAVTVLRGVDLSLPEGHLMSLLGPSGCGKTTTLRCVAGLEKPNAGTISVRGEAVADAAKHLFVPPEHRRMGMAFQSYALWPHMKVAANVAYPLRMRGGLSRSEIRRQVDESLERVGLGGKRDRYPRQLSGGEQQRVALARATVGRPDVLLLDEPLSNLDAKLRQETMVWLVEVLKDLRITTIYVTHDQTEALAVSDSIAVIENGQVAQLGAPEEIYERPNNLFVAEFIGATNLLPAHVVGVDKERVVVEPAGGGPRYPALLPIGADPVPVGTRVALVVRPESISVHEVEPREGGLEASVQLRVFLGSSCQYVLRADGRDIRVSSEVGMRLNPGDNVWLTFERARLSAIVDAP